MIKEKSEWKQQIYYIKVWTFRRTLELRIWWGKENCEEVWMGYNLTWWFCWFDEDKKAQYIFMDDDTLQELRDLGAI